MKKRRKYLLKMSSKNMVGKEVCKCSELGGISGTGVLGPLVGYCLLFPVLKTEVGFQCLIFFMEDCMLKLFFRATVVRELLCLACLWYKLNYFPL